MATGRRTQSSRLPWRNVMHVMIRPIRWRGDDRQATPARAIDFLLQQPFRKLRPITTRRNLGGWEEAGSTQQLAAQHGSTSAESARTMACCMRRAPLLQSSCSTHVRVDPLADVRFLEVQPAWSSQQLYQPNVNLRGTSRNRQANSRAVLNWRARRCLGASE